MRTTEPPIRKSLPLYERDQMALTALRRSPTHLAILGELAGTAVSESSSEAAVLHAVWEAGIQAVREQVEDAGYAAMAGDQETRERQAIARRRRPTWADES
ncbi:hypothetical protein KV112_20725 [Mycolicibacter sp. MYC123]|uniref:Uncharacterized protein n=1 Tax=[Mycobacterium] zoologicum TaxID=2872311 RepID=A0ABU5YQL5_9MYCO|nr:hypothetical protein [Mycolicibacter sp. MYC123]MEB3052136.1 hypothetical protein [Mycolicibacter sp. MYC123]